MLIFDDTSLDEKIKLFDRGVEISTIPGVSRPEIMYHDGATQVVQVRGGEPLMAMVDEFVRAIDKDTVPLSDGNAGLRMVKILEAAQHSLEQQGCPVWL